MDPLYDSYVQIFLSRYIPYKTIVGFIMSIDNIFALFLIPVVSVLSDKTRTPIGRRMPWIIGLLPYAALMFALVPYAAESSLGYLIIVLIALNLFKQSVRGPIVALMPDTIPANFRSEANGVINTMGNVAAIIGTLFLARLMDVDMVLPVLGATKNRLSFPVAGILVLLAAILLFVFVKEKPAENLPEKSTTFGERIRFAFDKKNRDALFILLSLFFWFVGYQALVPYITEYTIHAFNLSPGKGPISMGMVGISAALSAVPMGYAASKWGRKKIIRISLFVISIMSVTGFFIEPVGRAAGMPASALAVIFWASMFFFGVFWVAIITNSFPMLWQMADYNNIGLYTGLYYTFSQLAAIVAPTLAGLLIDITNIRTIFLFSAAFFLFAFFTMNTVQSGEKTDAPVSRA